MSQQTRIAGYRRDNADPPYLHPDYRATRVRSPQLPLIPLPHTLSEITGPVYGDRSVGELVFDVSERVSTLVREEIELAKTEVSEKVNKLVR